MNLIKSKILNVLKKMKLKRIKWSVKFLKYKAATYENVHGQNALNLSDLQGEFDWLSFKINNILSKNKYKESYSIERRSRSGR